MSEARDAAKTFYQDYEDGGTSDLELDNALVSADAVLTERERCKQLFLAFAADLFGVQDGNTWTIKSSRESDVIEFLNDLETGVETETELEYDEDSATIREVES